ncbi:type VI secretion system baseplate subunit TssF [Kaistella sp. G5-32]|uniref:Type VI secretion system baseplate subunit TssF n=1 Tax=Kaistella gelatinilytica TaxID=2787636 RepID=A0ABS0FF90_9FLAO|nr:type VI secretion system baseplate subunit TssF [Kaistella gelatinilytica]MBF8458373.1 type VI secretion system baseplate subunit TssF [Kaistella gelatinilytica]
MNLNQQIYSKEAIKARMLQNATKLWGLKNIQSLDPFVKLLIDAFSTEIFKANNEIESINGRILEKLSRLLTPTKYAHPNPSHAIAFSYPDEDKELIMEHSEYFLKKQLNSLQKNQSDKQVEISFTPIDSVELIRAQTALIIVGNTAYSIDEELNKIPILRLEAKVEEYRTIKLGIDISDYNSEVFPTKIALFCSNPTYENVDFVYRLLPHVKVFHNDIPLEVSSGLSYHEDRTSEGFEKIFEFQSIKEKIKEDIKNTYREKFIEVTGIYPSMFKKIEPGLPDDIDDGNTAWAPYRSKKILWLKLEFPPQFTAEILENFLFVLNAFPIYNRGWKKTEYALDIMGNNIPLETTDDEFFLYVDEVIDGKGKKYMEIPFTPTGNLDGDLYTLRKGGMERFTNRNATDLMAHVMELLRDEVAAFSIINRDKVKDVLGEISEKMKGLMKKVEIANQELKEDVNYVIIEPVESAAHTYASFWISHCTLANNIRPGTVFNSQKRAQSLTLLTQTSGGAEEQKQSDTILAYKYALTTKDKIISVEDVKNYCKMILKDSLKKINVSRGTMISDKPREGFIRTVDIEIVVQDYSYYGSKYWNNMATTMKNNIKNKAIDGIEYRLKISEDAAILEV